MKSDLVEAPTTKECQYPRLMKLKAGGSTVVLFTGEGQAILMKDGFPSPHSAGVVVHPGLYHKLGFFCNTWVNEAWEPLPEGSVVRLTV